jgi:nucleoside-diphosphate-sugar epimerase
MRYLVTGATCFLGARLARRLVAAGHEVRAMAPSDAEAGALADAGLVPTVGEVGDRAALRTAMAAVDGVFHIAAWAQPQSPRGAACTEAILEGTRAVCDSMRALGVPKGVFTSTLAVHSDTHGQLVDEHYRSEGPFATDADRSRWRAHYEVALPAARAGLPLVIVLPGLVYGPGEVGSVSETFRQYLRRELPMLPRNTAYCWAHVDDIAEAHVAAMTRGRPGEAYILAGPMHTFVEAFELAERITGIPAPTRRVSPGVLRLAAAMMGVVDAEPSPLRSRWRRRIPEGVTVLGNDAKARRELGFDPRSLEAGLREMLEHELRALGRR